MRHLEKMAAFFEARIEGYDDHMLNDVGGCRAGYLRMAEEVPADASRLLDLGCGTGLELSPILRRLPSLSVVGIDLSAAMLGRLREKFPKSDVWTVEGDYFAVPFGEELFSAAVSFESLHHFSAEKKAGLYRKVHRALVEGGVFLECDYMVQTEEEEERLFAEYRRRLAEDGCDGEEYYHFDTPLTVKKEMALLREAGFSRVEEIFREENTVLLRAEK